MVFQLSTLPYIKTLSTSFDVRVGCVNVKNVMHALQVAVAGTRRKHQIRSEYDVERRAYNLYTYMHFAYTYIIHIRIHSMATLPAHSVFHCTSAIVDGFRYSYKTTTNCLVYERSIRIWSRFCVMVVASCLLS